jgi:hypothetical protein
MNALRLALAISLVACGDLTGPNYPPLDITGEYQGGWLFEHTVPRTTYPGPSGERLARFNCSGSFRITGQNDDFAQGVAIVEANPDPLCQEVVFPFELDMQRMYHEGEYGFDYGWDFYLRTDPSPLVGCAFVRARAGESPGMWGAGGFDRWHPDQVPELHFTAMGVFDCNGELREIRAAGGGQRM